MKPLRIHEKARDALRNLKRYFAKFHAVWIVEESVHGGKRIRFSTQDVMALEEVRRKLAEKYPPDWLETYGVIVYGVTLAGCIIVYLVNAYFWDSWWNIFVLIVAPPFLIRFLPWIFWRREPGRPRWAHPNATLDRRDVAQINRVISSMPPDERRAVLEYCPAKTGAQFFEIWAYIQEHRA